MKLVIGSGDDHKNFLELSGQARGVVKLVNIFILFTGEMLMTMRREIERCKSSIDDQT